MNTEQYEILETELRAVISRFGTDEIRAYRLNVKFVTEQFTAFVWGLYWQIPSRQRDKIRAGLEDAHIETGLKKSLKLFA